MKQRVLRGYTNRRTVLKGLGAGTTVSLAGCLGGGGGSGDGDTVTYVLESPGDGVEEALNEIAAGFEEETGTSVEYIYTGSGEGVGERLSQLMSANTPPTMVQTTQADMARFYQEDIAEPIDDTYSAVSSEHGDVERTSRFRADGNEYLIPLYHQRGVNWYRSDIWDSAPETWEEELAQVESADGTDGLNGFFLGANGSDICVQYQVLSYLYQNGGRTFEDQDGEIVPVINQGSNRDRWVETLEHLDALHDYAPEGADAGCNQMSQAISSQVSTGQWYVGFRPPVNADTAGRSFTADINTYIPYGPSADDGNVFGSSIGLMRPPGSDAELFDEFVNYLYQPENITPYLMGVPVHNIPPFPGLIESDSYTSAIEDYVGDAAFTQEVVDNFLDLVDMGIGPHSEVEPFNPYGGTFVSLFHVGTGLEEVLLNDTDPADAVDTIQGLAEETIEQADS